MLALPLGIASILSVDIVNETLNLKKLLCEQRTCQFFFCVHVDSIEIDDKRGSPALTLDQRRRRKGGHGV